MSAQLSYVKDFWHDNKAHDDPAFSVTDGRRTVIFHITKKALTERCGAPDLSVDALLAACRANKPRILRIAEVLFDEGICVIKSADFDASEGGMPIDDDNDLPSDD